MVLLDWFSKTFGATTPAQTFGAIDTFVPTKDFFSDVFHSSYLQGLHYTIRHGNIRLYEQAHQWEAQGLVTFVGAGRNMAKARLQGKGKV